MSISKEISNFEKDARLIVAEKDLFHKIREIKDDSTFLYDYKPSKLYINERFGSTKTHSIIKLGENFRSLAYAVISTDTTIELAKICMNDSIIPDILSSVIAPISHKSTSHIFKSNTMILDNNLAMSSSQRLFTKLPEAAHLTNLQQKILAAFFANVSLSLYRSHSVSVPTYQEFLINVDTDLLPKKEVFITEMQVNKIESLFKDLFKEISQIYDRDVRKKFTKEEVKGGVSLDLRLPANTASIILKKFARELYYVNEIEYRFDEILYAMATVRDDTQFSTVQSLFSNRQTVNELLDLSENITLMEMAMAVYNDPSSLTRIPLDEYTLSNYITEISTILKTLTDYKVIRIEEFKDYFLKRTIVHENLNYPYGMILGFNCLDTIRSSILALTSSSFKRGSGKDDDKNPIALHSLFAFPTESNRYSALRDKLYTGFQLPNMIADFSELLSYLPPKGSIEHFIETAETEAYPKEFADDGFYKILINIQEEMVRVLAASIAKRIEVHKDAEGKMHYVFHTFISGTMYIHEKPIKLFYRPNSSLLVNEDTLITADPYELLLVTDDLNGSATWRLKLQGIPDSDINKLMIGQPSDVVLTHWLRPSKFKLDMIPFDDPNKSYSFNIDVDIAELLNLSVLKKFSSDKSNNIFIGPTCITLPVIAIKQYMNQILILSDKINSRYAGTEHEKTIRFIKSKLAIQMLQNVFQAPEFVPIFIRARGNLLNEISKNVTSREEYHKLRTSMDVNAVTAKLAVKLGFFIYAKTDLIQFNQIDALNELIEDYPNYHNVIIQMLPSVLK